MPRPSQAQDEALLAAGARLYPELGAPGLSVRRVAEAACVNPAMVHYHFGNKQGFLRAVLQRAYEEMYIALRQISAGQGDVMERLAQALLALAAFVRDHRALVARVWTDAQAGEPVALEFLRANAPRHLGLLMGLAQEAEAQGRLPHQRPLTRFGFIMGSVLAPIVIAGGARSLQVLPPALAGSVDEQILSDAALAQRVRWAMKALAA